MSISRGWPHTQHPPPSVELNRNSPQSKGLLIWTPFSRVFRRSAGTLKNFTGRTSDGTFFGAPSWAYDDPIIGPNISLPTLSAGFDWGDLAAVEGINQITLSAWAKKATGWFQDMIWAKHTAGTNGCFFLSTTTNTNLRFTVINAGSSRVDNDATFSFVAGPWYHLTGVYNGIDLRIYINGILSSTPSAQTGLIKNHTSTLRLGDFNGAGWDFEGDIAEPRIYDRALSAGEVWAMYDPATRWDLYKPITPTLWPVVAAAPTPPDAPTSLTATAFDSDQIDLAWIDNADDEDGFKIERSPDGSDWAQIDTAAADATSYNDTGLDPNTLYYYRVRAYNGAGDSAYTNTASATTPPDDVTLQQYLVWDGSQIRQTDYRYTALVDGVPEPDTVAGVCWIYVDEDDGDLKAKFGDGTIKTIVVDT